MHHEITAESWMHLQELLFADTWQDGIGRYRHRYVYRGLTNKTYKLTTALARLGPHAAAVEGALLRNFRKYPRSKVVENDSQWYWLAVAQHYGLPTRLLDWTFSPYVAAHFATAALTHSEEGAKYEHDGVIWAVNFRRLRYQLPEALKAVMAKEDATICTIEMLTDTLSLDSFTEYTGHDYVVYFEPPSIDERIVQQYAVFSMMPDPMKPLDNYFQSLPADFRNPDDPEEYDCPTSVKITIPKTLMWEVRDKLDQANITERTLFPGLDGLSKWLKRHYSMRIDD